LSRMHAGGGDLGIEKGRPATREVLGRRVPKIQKADSTETRVITPGSVLCPRKSHSNEEDEAGRQLLYSHPSGDALVADLEALDYVWWDRSNPGR